MQFALPRGIPIEYLSSSQSSQLPLSSPPVVDDDVNNVNDTDARIITLSSTYSSSSQPSSQPSPSDDSFRICIISPSSSTETNSYEDMSYIELRKMCREKGLSSKGKKAQLIQRLQKIETSDPVIVSGSVVSAAADDDDNGVSEDV